MAKKQEPRSWEEEQNETWEAEANPWYQRARQSAEALLDRPAFSYDPGSDPRDRAAQSQSLRLGRRAMADTMGKAAGLSGGYASSYAQSLGAQAYNEQLNRLAELLPDYYDRARAAYDRQTGALRDELSTALGLYDKDYQAFLDRQSARERQQAAAVKQDQWERQFAADLDQWERKFAVDQDQWERKFDADQDQWTREFNDNRAQWTQKLANDRDRWEQELGNSRAQWTQKLANDRDRWEQELGDDHERWTAELVLKAAQWEANQAASAAGQAHSDAASERSYAYRMAMLALQRGLSVSDSLLQAAGIDKAYAETIRRYFAGLNH